MNTSFARIKVCLELEKSGVIPIFYNSSLETSIQIIKSCYEGGFRAIEFTNRGDFAHEIFSELSKYVQKVFPEMILGAGTIIEPHTAALFIQLGAKFIVSPLLNEDMAKICNRRKTLWIPGCATVSEISKAEELGCEMIKMFPAREIGGIEFLKNMKQVSPKSNFMITGGVVPDEENLRLWFNTGATCIGIGSNLIKKEILEANDFDTLRINAEKLIQTIAKSRN